MGLKKGVHLEQGHAEVDPSRNPEEQSNWLQWYSVNQRHYVRIGGMGAVALASPSAIALALCLL